MTFYKFTHVKSGDVFYGLCNLPIKAEVTKEFFGLDDYSVELISEEEYTKECDEDADDI